jgi:hypothetical protein
MLTDCIHINVSEVERHLSGNQSFELDLDLFALDESFSIVFDDDFLNEFTDTPALQNDSKSSNLAIPS